VLLLLLGASMLASGRARAMRGGAGSAGAAAHAIDATADKAMGEFVMALRKREITKLLSFFSRTGTWSVLATGDAVPPGNGPHKMQYRDIVRNGHPTPEFLDFFFDGDDPFVMFVEKTRGKPWVRKNGNTFIPPGGGWKPAVHVRWRLEGGRFVVDQIASPGS
jgi:hypothetical protein